VNSYIECRYECIDNDLLDSINLGSVHSIAPYKSKGIEKASELPVCWSNKADNTGKCLLLDLV
jgi:ariadne-1